MDRRIGKDIHIVSNKICRKMDRLIGQFDCTHSQFTVILYLTKNKERDIFQRDIEEEFGIRRSSVSATLSNLEEKGYIKRSSVSQDARLKKITVTVRGEKIVEESKKIINDFEKELIFQITDEELDIFYRVLDKLAVVADN